MAIGPAACGGSWRLEGGRARAAPTGRGRDRLTARRAAPPPAGRAPRCVDLWRTVPLRTAADERLRGPVGRHTRVSTSAHIRSFSVRGPVVVPRGHCRTACCCNAAKKPPIIIFWWCSFATSAMRVRVLTTVVAMLIAPMLVHPRSVPLSQLGGPLAVAPPPPVPPEADTTLRSLTLLPGTLAPAFSSKTSSYKVVQAPAPRI